MMQLAPLRRLAALVLTGSIMLAGCSAATPGPQEAAQPPAEPAAQANPNPAAPGLPAAGLRDGSVVVNGRVAPATSLELILPNGGKVTEVLVQEGDPVTAGQPLVRLDTSSLELVVAEAEASLAETRAAYELLLSRVTPEQQRQAEAQVEQARAELRQAQARVSDADVAAAKAELQSAEQALAELTAGPQPEQLEIRKAELERAQASLQAVRDSVSTEKTQAELRMERLANNVRDAQAFYQRVYWSNRQRFGEDEIPPDEAGAEAAALRAVQNAELLLLDARTEFEALKKNEVNRIAVATADVTEAESRLRELLRGPEPSAVSDARARVEAARARIDSLTGAGRDAALARAQAGVAEAEAAYARLLAAPTTPELAIAEARVARSEAQLAQARLQLESSELRAPIDGVVAEVIAVTGEQVVGNRVGLVIADLSSWRIETDNLNELSVVHVREGDKATISFYALPGFTIPGTVTYITTIGQTDDRTQLTSNYRLVITPDTWDDRLRWNMTASVTIEPASAGSAAEPAAGGRP